jgi:hypothetical protein
MAMHQENESEFRGTWRALVESRLRQLRFGVIQLIVHDGRVVQVDCTERTRLAAERDHDENGHQAIRR